MLVEMGYTLQKHPISAREVKTFPIEQALRAENAYCPGKAGRLFIKKLSRPAEFAPDFSDDLKRQRTGFKTRYAKLVRSSASVVCKRSQSPAEKPF
jgi:hypothetical protein